MKNLIVKYVRHHAMPNVATLIAVAMMLMAYHAFTVWAAPLAQSIPNIIPYQGTLTNASGQPINSNTNFTFSLYNTPSGGTALWTEAQSNVPVQNGLFNVRLGSVTPIPSTVWSNNPLYLGVKVGNDAEMSPREIVGAVPFALNAGNVQTIADGSITSRKVNLNSGVAGITSASFALTSSLQDLPGTSTTIQVDTASIILAMATFDVQSDSTVIGELWLDGGNAGHQAIHRGGRDTIAQVYRIPVTAGTHTLRLRAQIAGSGSGTIEAHTKFIWFVVGN